MNADEQDLRNVVLTDNFAGAGQKLVENSIEISPTGSNATITSNTGEDGFKIDFGDITKKYTIKYQTKFIYDFGNIDTKPKFKNGVKINYETRDGSDYTLEFKKEAKPNSATRNNGAKNGKANPETKEITWTVDINYNQLDLEDAKVTDAIPGNQSLIDNSVKIYETSIAKNGVITTGKDVTDKFKDDINANQVNVKFGAINKSYRIEFKTKDKDDLYNGDEVYTNTAQFIPRVGEVHNLIANVTLPNQGEYIGKIGTHNKEDWTIDWRIDVNKSLSTIDNVTVTDDLGDKAAQILLKDTIKVTEAGSTDALVEGEDYELTITDNQFKLLFLNEITEAYEVTYSSYIVAEETIDITNEAEVKSGQKIAGTTEKVETVSVKISAAGGTGEGTTGNLVLKKTETDSNRPLADVEFNLVKTIGGEEVLVRQGKTDAEGKLKWKGLKYGTYTLNEVIPEGYIGVESRSVTVSADTAEGGVKTVPIENERKTGEIKISKIDSVTGETLVGAEFTIKNKTTNQEYTFSTDQDGVILEEVPFGEYTVKEIVAPEGYRITQNIPSITVEINKTATIEVEDVAFVDVVGKKSWIGDEGKTLPDDITVELLANDQKIDEQTVTQAQNWEYSFKDLDKYDENNEEIKYEIKEQAVAGYIGINDGFNLINIQTTSITGMKTWLDDNDATQKRPKSITVQVLNGKELVEEKEVTAEENWRYTFTGLQKYDTEGKKITYAVREVPVDGYKSDVNGFEITNLRVEEVEVTGEKIWKDNNNATDDRPDKLTVNLLRNGQVIKEEVVRPNANGKWFYSFKNLPRFNEEGVEWGYTVDEVEVNGYTKSFSGNNLINTRTGTTDITVEKQWEDEYSSDRPGSITINLLQNGTVFTVQEIKADEGGQWSHTFNALPAFDAEGVAYDYTITEHDVPGYASVVEGYEITNTRTDLKAIDITKTWLDDESDARPDTIEVELFRQIMGGELEQVDTYIVTAANDWNLKLTDLPAFDAQGKAYTYSIKEKPVDGYDVTIDGFNLTNLRVGTTSLDITKVWEDESTLARPDTIRVNVLQNGTVYETYDVTAATDWQLTVDALPQYDSTGKAYDYTVTEHDVPGYESVVEGYEITNTRTGVKSIDITKAWLDDNALDRPESITVELYRATDGGELALVDTVTLTAQDDWSHSLEDLPAFDENGQAYTYSIKEKPIDGYETIITGFDITNVRVGAITIPVTKTWKDDRVTDRPDSITVHLLRNGEKVDTVQLTAEMQWQYQFTNLPEYDENGKLYNYTIQEESVKNYETSIDGFTITNRFVSDDDVLGGGGGGKDPDKPTDPDSPDSPESPDKPNDEVIGEGGEIPKTATNIFNYLLVGFGLLAAGFILEVIRRRKQA